MAQKPFDLSMDLFYVQSNMHAIDESLKEIEQGKIIVKTIEKLEAMESE